MEEWRGVVGGVEGRVGGVEVVGGVDRVWWEEWR